MSVYGIVASHGGFVQTSRTERGAKNHARRNGYKDVYRMCGNSWWITRVATRVDGRWQKVNHEPKHQNIYQ